jgi:hypothetical protein
MHVLFTNSVLNSIVLREGVLAEIVRFASSLRVDLV